MDEQYATDDVRHPKNEGYDMDFRQVAIALKCTATHARTLMRQGRIQSRRLRTEGGLYQILTSEDNVYTYRATLKKRGPKV